MKIENWIKYKEVNILTNKFRDRWSLKRKFLTIKVPGIYLHLIDQKVDNKEFSCRSEFVVNSLLSQILTDIDFMEKNGFKIYTEYKEKLKWLVDNFDTYDKNNLKPYKTFRFKEPNELFDKYSIYINSMIPIFMFDFLKLHNKILGFQYKSTYILNAIRNDLNDLNFFHDSFNDLKLICLIQPKYVNIKNIFNINMIHKLEGTINEI